MAGILTDAQKTWMQSLVASSLDVTVTVQQPPSTPVFDAYGHDISVPTTVGTEQVNAIQPSATILQAYAGIIGSQRALVLRFMPTGSNIREGNQVVYLGKNWMVHGLRAGQSYTVTDRVLITTIS